MCALPDLAPTKTAYNQLVKEGLCEQARALVSVVLNRSWTAQRKAATFNKCSNICNRCGLSIETQHHRYWECPCNQHLGKQVKRTQNMVANASHDPITYCRAITPGSKRPAPKEPIQPIAITSPNWDRIANHPNAIYATDGSGGFATHYPLLRGVGGGLIAAGWLGSREPVGRATGGGR